LDPLIQAAGDSRFDDRAFSGLALEDNQTIARRDSQAVAPTRLADPIALCEVTD
jgi:hypothetical protein